MIPSHNIKSKNIVVKKREIEKTEERKRKDRIQVQNIKQPVASDIFQKGRQNGSKINYCNADSICLRPLSIPSIFCAGGNSCELFFRLKIN